MVMFLEIKQLPWWLSHSHDYFAQIKHYLLSCPELLHDIPVWANNLPECENRQTVGWPELRGPYHHHQHHHHQHHHHHLRSPWIQGGNMENQIKRTGVLSRKKLKKSNKVHGKTKAVEFLIFPDSQKPDFFPRFRDNIQPYGCKSSLCLWNRLETSGRLGESDLTRDWGFFMARRCNAAIITPHSAIIIPRRHIEERDDCYGKRKV